MTSALAAGLFAGYGVAMPVGPIASYLVSLGMRARIGVSAAAAVGAATSDGIFAAVAAFGGSRVETLLRPIAGALPYMAAAVLLTLAIRTLAASITRRHRNAATTSASLNPHGALRVYAGLVALTAINPATIAYFSAVILGDRQNIIGRSPLAALLFAAGALIASATWQLFITGSGIVLGRRLTGPRAQLLVSSASAAIMALLAGSLLLS